MSRIRWDAVSLVIGNAFFTWGVVYGDLTVQNIGLVNFIMACYLKPRGR